MSINKAPLIHGKGMLSILSSRGDDKVHWTHGDDGATAVAEREFNARGVKEGRAIAYAIYASASAPVAPGVRDRAAEVERTEKRIYDFDPLANEIVIVPRMAGG